MLSGLIPVSGTEERHICHLIRRGNSAQFLQTSHWHHIGRGSGGKLTSAWPRRPLDVFPHEGLQTSTRLITPA
eukprot:6222240-Prymnesium_polylepis.1